MLIVRKRTGCFFLGGSSLFAEGELLGLGAFQHLRRIGGRGQDHRCRGGGVGVGGCLGFRGDDGQGRGGRLHNGRGNVDGSLTQVGLASDLDDVIRQRESCSAHERLGGTYIIIGGTPLGKGLGRRVRSRLLGLGANTCSGGARHGRRYGGQRDALVIRRSGNRGEGGSVNVNDYSSGSRKSGLRPVGIKHRGPCRPDRRAEFKVEGERGHQGKLESAVGGGAFIQPCRAWRERGLSRCRRHAEPHGQRGRP